MVAGVESSRGRPKRDEARRHASSPARRDRFGAAIAVWVCASSVWFTAAVAVAETDDDFEPEVIDMTPDEAVGWSLRNVAAPVGAVFQGGFGYWYDQREISIDTTPSGSFVDLFYVRRNFQKRFEQAEAPVKVLLPPRIKASKRDALIVRAFQEGYRQQTVTLPMASRDETILIHLDPLPNTLVAVSHRYFADRTSLVFLTKEAPTFRVTDKPGGFGLILNETAQSSEARAAIEGLTSPMISRASANQVGEDFVLNVQFAGDREIVLRSRLDRRAARDLHAFALDLVPAAGSGDSVRRALDALSRVESRHLDACRMEFELALREQLDAGALSRALAPKGDFTDRYLRGAMRRLGEVSPDDGLVRFGGQDAYRPTVPIELEMALSQAGEARGFIALLRQFVAELESEAHRDETLRSLIAPEMDPQTFGVLLEKARAREQSCRASR